MRIQHNIPAMNAYRNYNTNVKALQGNLQKLSSGYKINKAGDDAAGLAISEKMRAQITGLEVAQKNAKDGISLVQTAEGAMTEIHTMLNRMFSLAEQSANGTYDDDVDRKQLQSEFEALTTEIDRIAQATNFNGKKLLNGDLAGVRAATASIPTGAANAAGVTAAPVSMAQGASPTQQNAANQFLATNNMTFDWSNVGTAGQISDNDTLTVTIAPPVAAAAADSPAITMQYQDGSGKWVDLSEGDNTLTVGDGQGKVSSVKTDGVLHLQMIDKNDSNKVVSTLDVSFDATNLKKTADIAAEDKSQSTTLTFKDPNAVSGPTGPEDPGDLPEPTAATATLDTDNNVANLKSFSLNITATGDELKKLNGALMTTGDGLEITVGSTSSNNIAEDSTITFSGSSYTALDTAGYKIQFKTANTTETWADPKSGVITFADAGNTSSTTKPDPSKPTVEIRIVKKDDTSTVLATGSIGLPDSSGAADGKSVVKFAGGTIEEPANANVGISLTDTRTPVWGGPETAANTSTAAAPKAGLRLRVGDSIEEYDDIYVSIQSMQKGDLKGSAVKEDGTVLAQDMALEDLSILKDTDADVAMGVIKDMINTVSTERGKLGATQNRLDHTINNLSTMQENIQDAEATIRDVDVAEEMMKYTKNNILVQSAQAMLAQANQLPQGVLQLLG